MYLAEEQQILREAYQSFFLPHPSLEVVGVSGNTSGEAMAMAMAALKPKVLLLGIKTLHPSAVEKLEKVRKSFPEVSIVLLSISYHVMGIKALKEFSRGASSGCAYLLKHTIDTVEQLTQVIHAVAEGRIIVDPTVMEGLMDTAESKSSFLRELSPRELEVLSWMAKGYRNNTIGEVLCLKPKSVERHINNIYSKLGLASGANHPRVHATTLYLKATEQISTNGPVEDLLGESFGEQTLEGAVSAPGGIP